MPYFRDGQGYAAGLTGGGLTLRASTIHYRGKTARRSQEAAAGLIRRPAIARREQNKHG